MSDYEQLNEELLRDAEHWLSKWLPRGKVRGNEFVCGDIAGIPGDSLSVNIRSGKWSDFATGDKGGDLISLYAAVHGKRNGEALRALREEISGISLKKPSNQVEKIEKMLKSLSKAPSPSVQDNGALSCADELNDRRQENGDSHDLDFSINGRLPTMIHTYRNAGSEILFRVARLELEDGKKEFRPFTWNGSKWLKKALPAPRPLYGLDLLAQRPQAPVVIVEGEKTCDSARKFLSEDYVVMTWPNGANSADKADWNVIKDRRVIIWPDADEPGVKAANVIAKYLPQAQIIDVSGMPKGWDAHDALVSGEEMASPQGFAKWVASRLRAPEVKGRGRPAIFSIHYEDFEPFFKEVLKGAKRDRLSEQLMFQENGRWRPVRNNIGFIRAEAIAAGLNRTYVSDYLEKYAQSLPLGLLVEIPKWDGKARMIELFFRVKFKDTGLSQRTCLELYRRWCANIFAKLDDPIKNQNQIMIFRGNQGVGKDSFIKKIFGTAFQSYFANIELDQNNKENFHMIRNVLVANISEFDQSNKLSLSTLKNLITADSSTFRVPYAPAPENFRFYASFISTTNFANVLRDPTGNRRFLIFDVESIDFDYDHLIDGGQLLAEMHHWYHLDLKVSDDVIKEWKAMNQRETPPNVDEEIVEDFLEKLRQKTIMTQSKTVPARDMGEVVVEIARRYGVSVQRVQVVINRSGYSKRDVRGRIYCLDRMH